MSKKSRKEKREEERRIIAELDAAVQEQETGTESVPQAAPAPKNRQEKGKQRYHCPKCKTTLEQDGKCPTCGYKMYMPMDEKTRNKIKIILTVVLMVIFAVMFVILQFRK